MDAKLRRVLLGSLLTGGLVTGVAGCSDRNNNDTEDDGQEPTTVVAPAEERTFKQFKQKMKALTPSIMLETILVEGLKLDNAGLCKPYDDGTGVWTIGFGLTELDGKPVTQNTRHITIQEAWKKSVEFYETRETYFFMWCYDVGIDGFAIDDTGKAFCLASVFYNSCTNLFQDPKNKKHGSRNTELRNLYAKYGENVTEDQVRAVFKKYPITNPRSFGGVLIDGGTTKEWADALGGFTPEGRGLIWRRWLEGQMAMGNITWQELLDLPVSGMSDFWKSIGGTKDVMFTKNNGKWHVVPGALPKFKEWVKNPVDKKGNPITGRKTLREIVTSIDSTIISQIEHAEFDWSDTRTNVADFVEESRPTYTCAEWNDMSWNAYRAKDYETALNAGQNALELAEDNKQRSAAHYNIGVTYTAMGKYNKAVKSLKQAVDLAATDTQRIACQKALSDAEQQQSQKRKQNAKNFGWGVLAIGAMGYAGRRYYMHRQKHR
jgi:hypothetical protein